MAIGKVGNSVSDRTEKNCLCCSLMEENFLDKRFESYEKNFFRLNSILEHEKYFTKDLKIVREKDENPPR